jgi:hypothetical protein
MPSALPQPRLLLPRYTTQDVFNVFSMFLDEQEFTYTSSVLAKELVARGFAAPSEDAEDDPVDPVSLREHLAFCVAKLAGSSGAIGETGDVDDADDDDRARHDRVVRSASGVQRVDADDDEDEDARLDDAAAAPPEDARRDLGGDPEVHSGEDERRDPGGIPGGEVGDARAEAPDALARAAAAAADDDDNQSTTNDRTSS